MVPEGLGYLHDDELAIRISQVGITLANRVARQHRTSGAGSGVVHVETAVALVIRIKGQAEQAFLVACLADPVRDVQESARLRCLLVIGEHTDSSRLFGNKDVVLPIVWLHQVGESLERQVGKCSLNFQIWQ